MKANLVFFFDNWFSRQEKCSRSNPSGLQ